MDDLESRKTGYGPLVMLALGVAIAAAACGSGSDPATDLAAPSTVEGTPSSTDTAASSTDADTKSDTNAETEARAAGDQSSDDADSSGSSPSSDEASTTTSSVASSTTSSSSSTTGATAATTTSTTAATSSTSEPAGSPATGVVTVQLEPVQGVFIEGFEVGLRFETATGAVIASTLWSDFVRSLGETGLDVYYESVLEQPVPAGTVIVWATANVGIGPGPEIPDPTGRLRCRLPVEVPSKGHVAVEVGFGERDDCLRQLIR